MVGGQGAFVATFRNRAEIVLIYLNRQSPQSATLALAQRPHSLGRRRHGALPPPTGWCTQTPSQGVNGLGDPSGSVDRGLKAGSRPRLFGSGPRPSSLQRTARVDFSRRDLSGKIARSAGPQGRIEPSVGGDAGNNRLAHKARPVRVRRGHLRRTASTSRLLSPLNDQVLKDIGVLLGHRRKILAAVAELSGKQPSGPIGCSPM